MSCWAEPGLVLLTLDRQRRRKSLRQSFRVSITWGRNLQVLFQAVTSEAI